jgi:uncharacterized coiled-coil DUF342 family protein
MSEQDYINMIQAENDRLKDEVERLKDMIIDLKDNSAWLRGELREKESVLGKYERGC